MDTMSKVYEELRRRRETAIKEAEERTRECEEKIPELAEINKILGTTGLRMFEVAVYPDAEARISAIEAESRELRRKKEDILTAHGFPADYDSTKWTCPECKDTGDGEFGACKCKRELLELARIESSGLGKIMKGQSFDNFSLDYYSDREQIAGHRDRLREWSENFTGEGNFILTGTTGLGKTHLSTSVAKAVIHRGYSVVYTTADEFFGAFQAQRFGGGHAGDGTTERFEKCDLLIIDDLGTEVTNKFVVSCLYNVINSRINNARATLISTNLDGRELQDRYEERTASRIFGNYVALKFSGKDIRRQKLAH